MSKQFNTKWSVPPRLISNKCESLWRLQSKQAAKNNSCSNALNHKGQLSLLIGLNVSEAVATISQLPLFKIMWGWTWLSLLLPASHLHTFHKSADLQSPTGDWDVFFWRTFQEVNNSIYWTGVRPTHTNYRLGTRQWSDPKTRYWEQHQGEKKFPETWKALIQYISSL